MASFPKLLIIPAAALTILVGVYLASAAVFDFPPFAGNGTGDLAKVEPTTEVPTPTLIPTQIPGTTPTMVPVPTVPPGPTDTPTTPPTPDTGTSDGTGSGGQPTPMPTAQNGGGTPPTQVPPVQGGGDLPAPTATPEPSGGGGGGGQPQQTDDDDDGDVTTNQSPVAANDSATVERSGSVVVNVLSNDSDPDGDPISIIGVTQGVNGSVTFGPTNVTYSHNGSATFSDTFNYFIADNSGGAGTAAVAITVILPNNPPEAQDDSFATDEDVAISESLLVDNGNGPDSDVDGDSLTINTTPVSEPINGILILNPNGSFTYTPNAEFSGSDAFQYQLQDGRGGLDVGDASITINAVDDPPVAVDDTHSVAEDSVNNLFLVLANDTDVDGGPISINSLAQPLNGTVLLVNAGTTLSYTPDTNYCNDGVTTDDFTYTLDPGGSVGTVRVTVTCQADPPLAGVDNYSSVGNTALQVGVVGISPSVQINGTVLDNDTDPDGVGALTVTGISGTSVGASVSMNPDGTFTYFPPIGLTGTDSFDYTVSNGVASSTGTVNVMMNNRVWYIDNSFAGQSDGRSSSPFQSLAEFSLVNGNPPASSNPSAGDTIFIAQGSGNYPGGVVLLDSQSLIGNGVTLSEGPLTIPAASDPNLTTGIVISSGNTIRGLNITATANDGIDGNNAGGTTLVDQVDINILSGSGNGIDLDSQSGTFTFSNGSITNSGSGAAVDISGGNAQVDFDAASTVTATNGTGLQFNNAGGSYDFKGAVTLNGGDAGIDILGGSAGTFTFANTTITNPTGTGFNVDGGNGDITYPGTISNTLGRSVQVANRTGGTISFSGLIIDTGDGVSLSSNAGSFNFTGGLNVTNNGATGFTAIDSGTVTVTGAANTINTTSGVGLNLTNTAIGAGGITFQSISASNAANGIVLSNTSTGAFTVTGTGTADGSGGTIQDTTGSTMVNGISLTNAANVSLSNLTLTNANEIDGGGVGVCDGNTNAGCNAAVQLSSVSTVTLTNVDIDGAEEQCINGNTVTGLRISDSVIQNCGNQINEHGIHIRELLGTAATGNTNRITNTTVRAANTSNVAIVNTTATSPNNQNNPDLLVVNNSTFSDLFAPNGSNGVLLLSRSNGNLRLEVANSVFRNLRSVGLKLNGEQGGDLQSDITTSTFEPGGGGQLTVGIETLLTQGSTHILNLHDNTKIETDTGTPVNLRAFDSASFTGRVTNNTIVQNASSNGNGNGIQAVVDGSSGNSVLLIENNTIQQSWFGRGIRLDARAGSGRLDATVSNNVINPGGEFSNDALEMFAGNGTGGEASIICVNLSGNTVNSGNFSDEYAAEQVSGNTFLIQGLTPASGASESQVEAFIAGTDTSPGGVTADVSPAGFGIVVNYQAATCNIAPAALSNQG